MDDHKQETSFKPLTVSLKRSGLSTPDQGKLTTYAAERARLLLGCYRKGDANDPDIYVAAVTATLARFPEDVIRDVTHPASGLPTTCNFLPTVKEVFDACEVLTAPRRRKAAEDRHRSERAAELAAFKEPSEAERKSVSEGFKALAARLDGAEKLTSASEDHTAC